MGNRLDSSVQMTWGCEHESPVEVSEAFFSDLHLSDLRLSYGSACLSLAPFSLAANQSSASGFRMHMSRLSGERQESGTHTGISRHALAHRVRQWIRASSPAAPGDAVTGDPVQLWKSRWRLGADARWSGVAFAANPYQHEEGSSPAKAWEAGWNWAEQQPDRRRGAPVRLAHPLRRSSDGESAPLALARSARTASVGVSAVVVAAWLWQTRRRKRLELSR